MTDKMLRVAGRGTDGTAKPISVNNEGNIEAVITGANMENDGTVSTASFRQDSNGNGIMRVYMENKLNASDGDSVNIDGVLANKLLRFPSGIINIFTANKTMLAKSAEGYAERVILDVNSPVEITSLDIVTWGNLPSVRIAVYNAFDTFEYIRIPTSLTYSTEVWSLQNMTKETILKYSHPLFQTKQLDETKNEWEMTNRDGKSLYFPYGIKIFLDNTKETEYNYAYSCSYNKFEVIL